MTILDTNVLSEVVKPQPEAKVLSWLGAQNYHDVYVTSLTVAEMRQGLNRMPVGKRHAELRGAVDAMFQHEFAGRILPFDEAAAMSYADLLATLERIGRRVASFDAQIAAVARVHSATVATRNTKDFELSGVSLVDRWAT